MFIRVARLREAMMLVSSVVPKKSQLDTLMNVFIGDGQLIACDLDTWVSIDLPEATDKCLLSHRTLELLKHIPGDEMLTFKVENSLLRLNWSNGSANYGMADIELWPPMPDIEEKSHGSVDGDLLVKHLNWLKVYCATDGARPVLNCVYLDLGKATKIVAADGFRLAISELNMPFPVEEQMLLPMDAVNILTSLWEAAPAPLPPGDSLISAIIGKRYINLHVGVELVSARFGRINLVTKLTQGDFPNYTELIPTQNEKMVTVDASELERTIRMMSSSSRGGSDKIRLSWDGSTLTVTLIDDKSADEINSKMRVTTEGEKGRIVLGREYLLDYLRGKCGFFKMAINREQDPVLIHYPSYPTVVLMPMFVQW